MSATQGDPFSVLVYAVISTLSYNLVLKAGAPPHRVFTLLFTINVMGSLTCKGCASPFTRDLHFTSYPRDGVFSTAPACIWKQRGEARTHTTLASKFLQIFASLSAGAGLEPTREIIRSSPKQTLYPLSHTASPLIQECRSNWGARFFEGFECVFVYVFLL